MVTEWLLELQPSRLSPIKEERLMGEGLFRKAPPMTSIPDTRIVLEHVAISEDQSVGSVSEKEKKGGQVGS